MTNGDDQNAEPYAIKSLHLQAAAKLLKSTDVESFYQSATATDASTGLGTDDLDVSSPATPPANAELDCARMQTNVEPSTGTAVAIATPVSDVTLSSNRSVQDVESSVPTNSAARSGYGYTFISQCAR